ncbi:15863_t:CDS:2 [Gigaspora margarita]|uniref:15863_t:CDS:1 n=1 Tax=Gigaspora margarita TaxID=4874 RepID=A0ABN7V230_GIGMA|nr:15863_t:CDS:2 [Gigaspora margarita]
MTMTTTIITTILISISTGREGEANIKELFKGLSSTRKMPESSSKQGKLLMD